MCETIKTLLFKYALNKFAQSKMRGNIDIYRHYEEASQTLHNEILKFIGSNRDDKETMRWLAGETEKLILKFERCAQEGDCL